MPPALPQWPQAWFRRGQRLWRQFLRHERPHRLPGRWNAQAGVSIGLACMLVGLLSAWPWLVQPTLRPGVPAPFEARAPGAATVVDSEALEQRRSQLGPRVQVQITDPQANKQLQQRLDRLLQELASSSRGHEKQLTPVSVTPKEQLFLESAGPQQLTTWGNQLRLAQQRMLAQGVVGSLASGQLLQASWLQLGQLEEPGRSLGAKVITRSLQGSTNLRTDNSLTQLLLNDLINETGVPKIQVRAGEVITFRPDQPPAGPGPIPGQLAGGCDRLWPAGDDLQALETRPGGPPGAAGAGQPWAGAVFQAVVWGGRQSAGFVSAPQPAAGGGVGARLRAGLAGAGNAALAGAPECGGHRQVGGGGRGGGGGGAVGWPPAL
ncbi:MAG: hypothetical protein EBU30_07075 [Synechococcaceae bacterium WB6_3B_236]|nr:hypothetical protein [Synechococcaceae bacterium WB6_3B_236]